LIFVGDGPLLPALRAKAASCPGAVRFTVALPRGDALNVLAESDLLILVSRHEGFPMSILEGMSMGLAVIASDVGGIEEAVTSDCGILIARGDKEALKRALVYLAGDRGAVDRLGAAAQERARNEFPVSSMFRETMAVYESVQAR
jgi:glycosyltransferase involved in cell wall biosynthesis